jgi:hypothetical protein
MVGIQRSYRFDIAAAYWDALKSSRTSAVIDGGVGYLPVLSHGCKLTFYGGPLLETLKIFFHHNLCS